VIFKRLNDFREFIKENIFDEDLNQRRQSVFD